MADWSQTTQQKPTRSLGVRRRCRQPCVAEIKELWPLSERILSWTYFLPTVIDLSSDGKLQTNFSAGCDTVCSRVPDCNTETPPAGKRIVTPCLNSWGENQFHLRVSFKHIFWLNITSNRPSYSLQWALLLRSNNSLWGGFVWKRCEPDKRSNHPLLTFWSHDDYSLVSFQQSRHI